jgi:hypothetical protein
MHRQRLLAERSDGGARADLGSIADNRSSRDLSGKLPLQITYLQVMTLGLTDEEAAALTQELHEIVENDRYPFSPRIQTLRAILAKLRPEPPREPLPPPKVYAPPSKGRYRRRG